MPKTAGKKFPYTKKGKVDAKKLKEKMKDMGTGGGCGTKKSKKMM